jgi:ABC-2 type transport system permease protein
MSWNLIQKEIGRNRNRFLMWLVLIGLFMLFTMMMIPTMLSASSVTASYLKVFPKAMLDAFGMDLSTWGSMLGMYATYHVFYSLVFGGIFAISLGGEILAKEENRKTADFLLTRPLSRSQIVASKLAVLVLYILLMDVAITVMGWVGLALSSTQPWSRRALLVLNLQSFLLTLFFATLGLFLSVLGRRGRSLAGVGTGIVVGAYFLDGLDRKSVV